MSERTYTLGPSQDEVDLGVILTALELSGAKVDPVIIGRASRMPAEIRRLKRLIVGGNDVLFEKIKAMQIERFEGIVPDEMEGRLIAIAPELLARVQASADVLWAIATRIRSGETLTAKDLPFIEPTAVENRVAIAKATGQ